MGYIGNTGCQLWVSGLEGRYDRIVVPHVHGEDVLRTAGRAELQKAALAVLLLAGIEGDKGDIEMPAPDDIHLLCVFGRHAYIILPALLLPDPAVEVPRVVYRPALEGDDKGDPFVGAFECLDVKRPGVKALAVAHPYDILCAAAAADVAGEYICDPARAAAKGEYVGIEMVAVPVIPTTTGE